MVTLEDVEKFIEENKEILEKNKETILNDKNQVKAFSIFTIDTSINFHLETIASLLRLRRKMKNG